MCVCVHRDQPGSDQTSTDLLKCSRKFRWSKEAQYLYLRRLSSRSYSAIMMVRLYMMFNVKLNNLVGWICMCTCWPSTFSNTFTLTFHHCYSIDNISYIVNIFVLNPKTWKQEYLWCLIHCHTLNGLPSVRDFSAITSLRMIVCLMNFNLTRLCRNPVSG